MPPPKIVVSSASPPTVREIGDPELAGASAAIAKPEYKPLIRTIAVPVIILFI